MYIAIDQYGQTYNINKHPRKELCEQLYNKHVDIMYAGEGVKVGYVIGKLWLNVYKLSNAFKEGARTPC